MTTRKNAPLPAAAEIRIVAPSQSWQPKRTRLYRQAIAVLTEAGYDVTLGDYIKPHPAGSTISALKRAADIVAAYKDNAVQAIIALEGGWAANEVLPYLDWQAIARNPKPFIGYSDITVLLNAIYAQTGNHSYLGPNLGTIGYAFERQYTLDSLQALLGGLLPFTCMPSAQWSNWDRRARITQWKVLQQGETEARVIGGNLGSFYLLQGTRYMPGFNKPFIFAAEDDEEAAPYALEEFLRRFESLLQLPDFRKNMRGLLIGRFQPTAKVDEEQFVKAMNVKGLDNIPIVYNFDIGHTLPMLSLPIGGTVRLSVRKSVSCEVLEA